MIEGRERSISMGGMQRLAVVAGVLLPGIVATLAGCDINDTTPTPTVSLQPLATPTLYEVPRSNPDIGGRLTKIDLNGSNLDVCFRAYSDTDRYPIRDVNVTIEDEGNWYIMETVKITDENKEYCITEDLNDLDIAGEGHEHIHLHQGKRQISMDVFNDQNQVKEAPNGVHEVNYTP
ncbi:MAG: hypothetical protein ABIO02_03635 [Patescibacteria group bacterium]